MPRAPRSLALLVAAVLAVTLTPSAASADDQAVIDTAIAISQQRFGDHAFAGTTIPRAAWGVLARTGVFADSLSGSGLTGAGPLLFTAPDAMDAASLDELDRVLPPGDRVFLLGGPSALSAEVEAAVEAAGFVPVRLAGPSRIETSLAIAQQVSEIGGSGRVGLARADGPADNPTAAWADSVTAGTWSADQAVPVILNPTSGLHPAVEQYLRERAPETTYLFGGEAALGPDVESGAAAAGTAPVRSQGTNRYATAVAIATQLWGGSASGDRLITSGNAVDGWAYGLAAAGLGAQLNRPLLLVETDRLPTETDEALCDGGTRADSMVIGGPDVVSQAVRDALAAPC